MSAHPPLKPLLLDLLNFTQAQQHLVVTELSEVERNSIGTPSHWSARDHIAHITYWKRHLADHLDAKSRSEKSPAHGDTESVNARIFKEQPQRPWPEILHDADQAHTALLAAVERFTEPDFIRSDWPVDEDEDAFSDGLPLWGIILRNGFWHLLEHFTQFYLEHDNVPRATQLQQTWADEVTQSAAPPMIRSIAFYTLALFYARTQQSNLAHQALQQATALNHDPVIESFVLFQLASFYATTSQRMQAREALHNALTLNPDLSEYARQDSDLASLLEK